jgi:hypothetical protein
MGNDAGYLEYGQEQRYGNGSDDTAENGYH